MLKDFSSDLLSFYCILFYISIRDGLLKKWKNFHFEGGPSNFRSTSHFLILSLFILNKVWFMQKCKENFPPPIWLLHPLNFPLIGAFPWVGNFQLFFNGTNLLESIVLYLNYSTVLSVNQCIVLYFKRLRGFVTVKKYEGLNFLQTSIAKWKHALRWMR